jgi:hypothetical protein
MSKCQLINVNQIPLGLSSFLFQPIANTAWQEQNKPLANPLEERLPENPLEAKKQGSNLFNPGVLRSLIAIVQVD